MKATQRLREPGQSLWLDDIAREMLIDGTLGCYAAKSEVLKTAAAARE